MKRKLREILDNHMNDAFAEMYQLLEKENGCKYSGDISPMETLALEDLENTMVDIFVMISAHNREA